MIRQVIKIDEDKCTGCGICADACQEGAIGIVDGKAKLLRDDYCDGLGNCLPTCPTNAISFETREAAAFDEDAVKQNMQKAKEQEKPAFVCPGSMAKAIKHNTETSTPVSTSQLSQWPVQIKLVPVNAPYFDNANLLIAADCSAYAYGNFRFFRRFFYRQRHFKVDRHVCFGLRTHRCYGSFAVKITSEVSFFVAHSGISSCSADTRKMTNSVCSLPNGRERADTTGVSPQLTICQSRPHRLRRFYHARTVTGREYHYALCGSQRNRELPGILSR